MRSAAGRARLLIQRAGAVLAVLAGGAVLFTLLAGRDENIEEGEAQDERGYYLADATLTELGPDGRPRVVVRARSIEQNLTDESVALHHLVLDYTTLQAGQWHVTADRGHLARDHDTLRLAGNVRVAGSAGPGGARAVVLTDELAYDTRANLVHTAAPVVVQFGAHRLDGRGLRVALNDGTLRLESNVNGTFNP